MNFELSPKQRELLNALLREEGVEAASRRIPRRPKTSPAPLSFSQERLWYLNKLVPDSFAYNIPVAVRLSGPLDVAALERALNEVIRRHEILRTAFPLESEYPTQTIVPELTISLPVVDLSIAANRPRLSEREREAEIQESIQTEAQTPFDISTAPLLRAALLKLDETNYILRFTIHHIISDGWSLAILFRELSASYAAIVEGQIADLSDLTIQYADFAHWQRERLKGDLVKNQLHYWKEQLSGELPTLELATDHPRPAIQTFDGKWVFRVLPAELAESIKSLSKQEGVTLLVVLLAAFKTLLHRYTGQNDILIGSPVTNRIRVELEDLIGHFINTQVFRINLSGNPRFRELLQRVRETVLGGYANQDIPFEVLLDNLETKRDPSKNPLFQVVFILQDTPARANWRTALQLPGIRAKHIFTHSQTAKFDLTVEVEDMEQGLTISLEYNTDLFNDGTMGRMLGHFQTLLEGIAANPDKRISDLPLLTGEERKQIASWNDTWTDYPRDKCVHELFEEQAERTPDAIALVFEDQKMTYRELNRRANQIAHHLRKSGVGPDVLVGIAVERSLEMVVGLLGILKAGGAFVPLESAYPKERLAFMLEDTQTPVLLAQDRLVDALPAYKAKVVRLDTSWDIFAAEPEHNPDNLSTALNLAYVMYTSGSTGRPKGTGIPHQGIARLVKNTNFGDLGPEQVFLQFSPISFDAATLEIWAPLLNGSRLVIFPPHTPSFEELGQTILNENVTFLWLTAGLFHKMVEKYPQGLQNVRQLFSGGDVVSPSHVKSMLKKIKDGRIINGYGPTENTTFTTTYPMTRPDRVGNTISIGKPIANTQVYILDPNLRPVPIGIVGELYTGGDGLARDYLNRPELTADRFIPNPFSNRPGERMYKTGDLARWLPDGNIDFLGRRDFQVKIRGFRIELGEIEANIGQHANVKANAVIARADESHPPDAPGSKRLVAYIVPHQEPPPSAGELRNFLVGVLPDYMVPSVFVFLDNLPLTENGKLDRRALPAPPKERPSIDTSYIAPQTDAEKIIAGIWQDVLQVEKVGLEDNFFDLGGHSLLMLQVHSKLKEAFGADIPMIQMFIYPTITSMAGHLSSDRIRSHEKREEPSTSATLSTRLEESLDRAATRRERMQRRRRKIDPTTGANRQ